MEDNRKKVLSDNVMQKFQDDIQNFGSQIGVQKNLNEIQDEFNRHLSRVYNRGSHDSGVQGCQKMIGEYCSSVEVATVFLKSLMDKNVTQISKDSNQFQIFQFLAFHASLFGFMALKFR